MSKFLVTGATGFIGSNLCRRLINENHEVHIICRKNSSFKNLEDIINKINVFVYESNLDKMIDYFNKIKPDCVFHLASLIIVEHKSNDVFNLIDSNINFSSQVLEAMNVSGLKYIVNTGTYWQHYKNEAYNPVCLYAATKKAFADILTYYVNAYNFKAITLELFDSYGENDTRDKLINNLKNIAMTKEELVMSNGFQQIDLTHVDDIVDAYIHAFNILKEHNFENDKSYAVCTGRLVTLRELIEIFEKENNINLNIKWGEKPYRFREVLNPWNNYIMLPNWKSKICLEEGVKRIGKRA